MAQRGRGAAVRSAFGDRMRAAGLRPPPGPVRVAALSDGELPDVADDQPLWPLRHMTIDGAKVGCRVTPGPAGADPAVYVPGLGGTSSNWTDVAALLQREVAGVSVDPAGFGESDPPLDGNYAPPAHAHRLARFIEQQFGGRPVHLFGNSLGGVVTLLAAVRRPDLVRSLTLVSPAMPDLRPHGRERMMLVATVVPGVLTVAERRGGLSAEQHVRMVVDTVFGDASVVNPDRFAAAVAEAERHAGQPWASAALRLSLRGLIASYVGTGRRSLWNLARQVRVPSLVVWGDRDRLVDVTLAHRTARALPDSRLLVLPGVGHVAHMETPRLVARAFCGLLEETHRRDLAIGLR